MFRTRRRNLYGCKHYCMPLTIVEMCWVWNLHLRMLGLTRLCPNTWSSRTNHVVHHRHCWKMMSNYYYYLDDVYWCIMASERQRRGRNIPMDGSVLDAVDGKLNLILYLPWCCIILYSTCGRMISFVAINCKLQCFYYVYKSFPILCIDIYICAASEFSDLSPMHVIGVFVVSCCIDQGHLLSKR